MISFDKLDPSFPQEVMKEPGGEYLLRCFACGPCAATCPVREIEETYNPRKIIRMVVLGMRDEVLKSDFIWLCGAYYMCQERCPQDVRITELINAIKNVAVKHGYIHPSYTAQLDALKNFSRLYEVGEFENKKRERMGLPALDVTRASDVVELLGGEG